MDVVGGVLLGDGREAKILTGIDDHSRFVVCAGLMLRATSRAVCSHFAQAMARHGVPQEILTDNGKVFTGRFGAKDTEVLFDRICRENGIDHLLTAPRRPTTTGKIERFHRTLRTEFLTGRVFDDLPTAQDELDRWVVSFNTERPHSALDMATPASRYTPSTRPYQGLEELDYPFHDWTAVVTRCGRICYQRRKINLSQVFAGQTVGVKQTAEHIWLVSFMDYDLGYFDDETCRLEPIEDPFGPRLLPMSPE
jgi:putative transposase